MCMIICKEIDIKLPTPEIIQACTLTNRDGIGIAWNDGETVRIKKDFETTETFIEWLPDNLKEGQSAFIHFRQAAHGLCGSGNRRPFPISKNQERLREVNLTCDLAVAHNGVFIKKYHKLLSDTQLFIMQILAQDSIRLNLRDKTIQLLLKEYIGTYNKLAFIDKCLSIVYLLSLNP